MARIVKGALLQATWTGDKESMIEKHIKYVYQAAEQGAQVMCLQELFYGPYFCQVQDRQHYSYAEPVPGPTTEKMQKVAQETNVVLIVPVYEEDGPGIYYNTAAVIDADWQLPGQISQDPFAASRMVFGKSSIFDPATWAIQSLIRRLVKLAFISAMTATSQREHVC